MSGPPARAAWQRAEVVQAFVDERHVLLPLIDVQEDLLRRLFERSERRLERFLDLGAGDGAMTRLVLGVQPHAEAVLVDFSEPMLERARERLAHLAGRWSAVRADLADPGWCEGLPRGGFDAAVSAFAIHHLTAERKRGLFAEVYELLAPDSMFVNMDYVSVRGPLQGLFDEQMAANAVRAERERGGPRSDERVRHELFDDGDEDRPDGVGDQLGWLEQAGFEQPEVHFKWAEAAVFGATKPEKGSQQWSR